MVGYIIYYEIKKKNLMNRLHLVTSLKKKMLVLLLDTIRLDDLERLQMIGFSCMMFCHVTEGGFREAGVSSLSYKSCTADIHPYL